MQREDIIKKYIIDEKKLLAYGFKNKDNVYFLKRNLNKNGFYVLFEIQQHYFSIKVIDIETEEEYIPFNIQTSKGAFVSEIREEINDLLMDIVSKCMLKTELKNEVILYIQNKYHVSPVYPWEKSPSHGTFKTNKSQKWFGLIMNLPYQKLGLNIDGYVDVMNFKLEPSHIQNLIDHKHFFPAYHMNKKYWVSVILDKEMPLDTICHLIDESYHLVEK